ncbi:MAG: SAVED domain-containing protein [Nitrospinae bacterium]|nr:SAVED domain-containing protein [Nitrospinota bacterium]
MVGSLSKSGARIRGDDYQHLFTWFQALRALQQGSDIIAIGIEDPDAGSVDDATVYRSRERSEFYQVKSSVDAKQVVNIDWLTGPSRAGGPSILQRLHQSWIDLTRDKQRPKLGLVTNRPIDTDDPVVVLRDGRDGTVARQLAEAKSKSKPGKARKTLAVHLDVEETELMDFLGSLHFYVGKLHEEWEEQASFLMYSLGLRADTDALCLGVAAVRGWVTGGKRKLSVEEIRKEVESLNLRKEEPVAMLLVQAIERDPMPESATLALDWVDLYEGDEPRTRRRLQNGLLWNERLRPEIQQAVRQLRGQGHRRILVRGYMRLPTWFTLGAEFGKTAGFDVVSLQGGEPWDSAGEIADFPVTVALNETLGEGNDLALGVSLATDLSADVLDYLPASVPSAGRYICIVPRSGPSNRALSSSGEARGWALEVRNLVRRLAQEYRPNMLHLFLATPHGAALLLGHSWDRIPHTQLYEDQGTAGSYLPSFLIPN